MRVDMGGMGHNKRDTFCCIRVGDDLYKHARACCICGCPGEVDGSAHMPGNNILAIVSCSDVFGNAWVVYDHIGGYTYPHNNNGDARTCIYPPRTDLQNQK